MSAGLIEERQGIIREFVNVTPQWETVGPSTYQCRVLLCPEAEGGYSAHALRLPGVVSEGETIQEALDNIADAFRAAIQAYIEGGGTIPWGNIDVEDTKGCQEKWILVDV